MRAASDNGLFHLTGIDWGDARELVVVIDTLVADVHFVAHTAPADLGFKSLAVNLSDLAAMGADPCAALASVCHPESGTAAGTTWLHAFRQGLESLAADFQMTLGPVAMTGGPLCVTVEALGSVPAGLALTRGGAAPGDRILVTGTLGDAGLALAGDPPGAAAQDAWLRARLTRPAPRVAAGLALRGLASAAIDVSDGLAADLGHILEASRVGARLEVDALPLSWALRESVPLERGLALALASGDDYELCFTVAPGNVAEAERRLGALPGGVSVIGTVNADPGLRCVRADGSPFEPAPGYRHFS